MASGYCHGCMEKITAYPCPRCGYTPSQRLFPYALMPGTVLNEKYLIGKVLGQGGFGITYIGLDLQLQRKVAIKEYYPSGFAGRKNGTSEVIWYSGEAAQEARRSGQEMVLKEARKMSRVENINAVVRVFDVFQANETAYICMDFVEGQTLQALLNKSGPLPWKSARVIFLPIIQAMAQVHQAGLIHRDLSPDNLMILPDGGLKILDLGAAKDLNLNSGKSSMMVAKNGFSPLEQYGQTGNSGSWTDVYALAATMYYTLTGVLPPSAIDRVDKDGLRWDLPQLQALPPEVCSALKRALAVRSGSRTQTMGDFLQELQGKAVVSNTVSNTSSGSGIKQIGYTVASIAAAAVVIAAVLLVIAGIYANRKSAAPSPGQTTISEKAPSSDWQERIETLRNICTKEIYDYRNGCRMELYFDENDQECLRIFVNEGGDEEYIFLAEYDRDGNLLERCGFEYEELARRVIWNRNKAGNATEILTYQEDGSLFEKTEITYDSQDRETSRTKVNSEGTVTLQATSTYDDQGRETYTGVYDDGSSFVSTYNADGKILENITYDENGRQEYRLTYQYDADGKETGYCNYNENDELTYRSEYHYDGDVQTGYTSCSYYNGGESLTEYEYILGPRDIQFGQINLDEKYGSQSEYVRAMGGTWNIRQFSHSNYSSSVYQVSFYDWNLELLRTEGFDDDGNLVSTSEPEFDENGEKIGTRNFSKNSDGTYSISVSDLNYKSLYREEFSAGGKLTKRTDYLYDAGGNSAGSITAEYSEDGSYTERETDASYHTVASRTYDSSGTLISSMEYSYDASGNRTGSVQTTYYYDGSYTVIKKDANSRTVSQKTYDANGNPI